MNSFFATTTRLSVDEAANMVRECLQTTVCLGVHGGRSKTALATPEEFMIIPLYDCQGVLEYEPSEFTFTALAGTPVAEIATLLAEHGQYLPFDPMLASKGATLGGTVAANMAGAGRYRYGGVRDFLIGVRFVDGRGNLVRGGGKVVKNAAGFDFPKFFVGSLGRFGILLELTFKVFPRPSAYATLKVELPEMATAVQLLQRLTMSSLEMDALDLTPPGTLWIRIGGLPEALGTRLEKLQQFCGGGEILLEDEGLWDDVTELVWLPEDALGVKIPLTPKRILSLEAVLASFAVERRYSVGGNVAWIAWYESAQVLSDLLTQHQLNGLAVVGTPPSAPPHAPLLGKRPDETFVQRVKQVFDPDGRFGPI
jgi:glycolate oxidase FAD binding subunit